MNGAWVFSGNADAITYLIGYLVPRV